MNRERWAIVLPFITAWCEGKTLQVRLHARVSSVWGDVSRHGEPDFGNEDLEWRLKPTPRLRPWKPEEVPVGEAVRLKSDPQVKSLIVGMDRDFDIALHSGLYDAPDLLERWELLDGSPCGVSEATE